MAQVGAGNIRRIRWRYSRELQKSQPILSGEIEGQFAEIGRFRTSSGVDDGILWKNNLGAVDVDAQVPRLQRSKLR